ncbi:hypothetical protein UlMin_019643 [Ulmus minor]
MAKEREKEKISVKSSWNYPYELKLLLIVMLTLFSLATLFQFLPSRFTISTSDLRFCIASSSPLSLSPSPPSLNQDQLLSNGVLKRAFNSYGSAAYSFIAMSAYRGGLNTFAIIGLASKPLHDFGDPTYECRWVPELNSSEYISTVSYRMLPDKGHGRVYSVVVLNCTFSQPINANNSGGKLILYANNSGGGDWTSNHIEIIEVLSESPGSLNFSLFTSPPKYDYFYCGSPLFGNLSPQRIREWLAYHVWLFGPKSHFVIYDSGGIHEEVMEVVKPWMELGYVSLHDIRDEERFDGFYHNQVMVLNDCLHRYKFMAKWMFFFDVDEFVYVAPNNTIKSVLDSHSEYTQYTFPQKRMSNKLCLSLSDDAEQTNREWGFEKLVYRDVNRSIRRPRKYVMQPRNVYSAGIHVSRNYTGKTIAGNQTMYFHYHRTIVNRGELCKMLINSTEIYLENRPFVLDTGMRDLASFVKKFELKMIGSTLQNTPT